MVSAVFLHVFDGVGIYTLNPPHVPHKYTSIRFLVLSANQSGFGVPNR